MTNIRLVTTEDEEFWFTVDRHLDRNEFNNKVYLKQGFVIEYENKPVGVMRYNLFWDQIPFLNLIYIKDDFHNKGIGRQAMLSWEEEMRKLGHKLVMTSTMVEETSQHFYRKLNYTDCGCLVKNFEPFVETMEMFMMKQLL